MPGAPAPVRKPRVDYYVALGVPRTATAAELKRAFRAKALEHHPDKNPTRVKEATEAFKLVAEAYSVLRDDQLRVAYDCGGCAGDTDAAPWPWTQARSFNMGRAMDLFRDVFGEDVAAGLARAAETMAPKVQAAAAPITSALATAADLCSKAEVVREAMAAGLGTMAADADEEVESWVRAEEHCNARLATCRERLQDHEAMCRAERDCTQACLDQALDGALRASIRTATGMVVLALSPLLLYWRLTEVAVALRALALLAAIDFTMLLWAVYLWRNLLQERRARLEAEQRLALQGDLLKSKVQEAQRAAAAAREHLSDARGVAARAREELATAEREGASLGGAVRVGLHLCGKLVRRASGTAARQHGLLEGVIGPGGW